MGLTIRKEQMRLIERHFDHKYVETLIPAFSHSHGETEGLRGRLQDAVTRARRYGMVADDDVEWFVRLDLGRGARWEKQPGMEWALEILKSRMVDASSRRFRLEKWLERWDSNGR